MNCLNCAEYLGEALDSVFSQTYKNWEIILWDNASMDNSAEIAKSYGERVKYFRSDKTYPLGRARNLAIEKATGRYVAFLDCDDIWLPEKLEKQISALSSDSEVGLVFSDAIYFNKKSKSFQLYGKNKPPEGYVFGSLLKKWFLCLSTVVIKKETLSGLNEWFDARFNYIEDTDLFLRIAYDWKIAYVDDVLAKYRMHEESWTYKYYLFFPEEKEILVKKLLNLYPNLSKEYSCELKAMQAHINYEKFVLYWKKNERKRARQYLRPFIMSDKKLLLAYIFSYFFSFPFFMFLLRAYREKTYSP
ncbi:MAG: glycosyltransferase [Candidatus Paceibacterota bacterium]